MRLYVAVVLSMVSIVLASPALSAEPRMYQAAGPNSCATPLADTGKPVTFPKELDETQRRALMSAIFLTLSSPSGSDAWPAKEVAAAPPCVVARFGAGDQIFNLESGGPGLPPRFLRRAGQEDFLFYLVQGPNLNDATAWDRAGRVGLPRTTGAPAYYLIDRERGMNHVMAIYDGPPSGLEIANSVGALMEQEDYRFLGAHDPVGDAVSLFFLTPSGPQAAIFRPQDIVRENGYAALYFADGEFFTAGQDGALVAKGSGFTCKSEYGTLSLNTVGVINPTDETLGLTCNFTIDGSEVRLLISRRSDAAKDKADFEFALRSAQEATGVSRKLSNPPQGPTKVIQAGRTWLDKGGRYQATFILRRGLYVYQIDQQTNVEGLKASNEAVLALLDQIDATRPNADAGAWTKAR